MMTKIHTVAATNQDDVCTQLSLKWCYVRRKNKQRHSF